MNPLLEQFASEARELIEKSSEGFLNLEKQTDSEEIINNLFRYVHTIKGSSGLFEIEAFTRLVHVAEDYLSKARDHELTIGSESIDVFLQVLDQLLLWVDELEQNEVLPLDSQQVSQTLIVLLQQANADAHEIPSSVQESETPEQDVVHLQWWMEPEYLDFRQWLKEEVYGWSEEDRKQSYLLRYRPDAESFFRGEDPIHTWCAASGCQWHRIRPLQPWGDPVQLDPFRCNLEFIGVFQCSLEEIESQFQYVWSELDAVSLEAVWQALQEDCSAGSNSALAEEVLTILTEQLNVIRHTCNTDTPNVSTLVAVTKVLENLKQQCDELSRLPQCPDPSDGDWAAYLDALQRFIDEVTVQPTPDQMAADADQVADTSNVISIEKAKLQRSEGIRTLKVDQQKVDELLDLAAELIVAKNGMQHLAKEAESEYGSRRLARDIKSEQASISRIAEALHSVVMDVRMIPVSVMFQRFPRLVRDLSRKLGKQIDLRIEGEDTEADKSIIEELADPLIHIVRNSIDHGIEMPDDRKACGKSETGTIHLKASAQEDTVVIEIEDDGKGLNADFIKQKALEKQLLSAERLDQLNLQETYQLIFAPGFSTREEVSDLSGRGVGMDVVNSVIKRVGGEVEIDSVPEQGTRIRLLLPSSMTVNRVMMFEVGGQAYAFPMDNVTETIKIPPSRVQRFKNKEGFVLRNQLIPLFRMDRLLSLSNGEEEPGKTATEDEVSILTIRTAFGHVGVIVDRLLEGVDVILKPLEGLLTRYAIYSGAAVLGDGRVLLVLSPNEVLACQ